MGEVTTATIPKQHSDLSVHQWIRCLWKLPPPPCAVLPVITRGYDQSQPPQPAKFPETSQASHRHPSSPMRRPHQAAPGGFWRLPAPSTLTATSTAAPLNRATAWWFSDKRELGPFLYQVPSQQNLESLTESKVYFFLDCVLDLKWLQPRLCSNVLESHARFIQPPQSLIRNASTNSRVQAKHVCV